MKIFKFDLPVPETNPLIAETDQIPVGLKTGEKEATDPVVRASVTRVAFACLVGSGALSGLACSKAATVDASFSCALATAVNVIASIHYYLITAVREQVLPVGHPAMRVGRDLNGRRLGGNSDPHEDVKLYAQETIVDMMRHSDWAVTLPLMTVDLARLASHATSGATMPVNEYAAASMMALVVVFGGVYRFYANEWRVVRGRRVATGVVTFGGSCALFAVVLWAIVNPILSEACWPTSNATVCPIRDPLLKHDSDAVLALTFIWVGYPVVALLSRSALTFVQDGYVSLAKDVACGLLDVASKGGLATYVAFRTTWVVATR